MAMIASAFSCDANSRDNDRNFECPRHSLERNRRVRCKGTQFFLGVIDQPLHVARIKLTRHDDERAFPVNNSGTRRDDLRHFKNDEARMTKHESMREVRIVKGRRFDFDISSAPSTFVIRTSSFAGDKFVRLRCEVQNRHSRPASYSRCPIFTFLVSRYFDVVRIGFAANRHLFYHLKAITLKADNFLRVIRQKTELADTEVEEDLRAEAVIAQIAWVAEPGVRLYRIEPFLLQFVSVNFAASPMPRPSCRM